MQTKGESANLPLVLAVDVGGTQIRAAVLRGATVLSRVGLLTGENPTPTRVIPRIYTAIEQALNEANHTLDSIAGIGIGAPGPLNGRTGVIYNPPNLQEWDDIPLKNIFVEHYNLPVFVENDANAAGLGEYMFGAGQGCMEMVYLTVSTGIGGGIISNGKLVVGTNGSAGELGHMTIDWQGGRCNCGNIGCLEYLASGTAIARLAMEAIEAGTGEELVIFAHILKEREIEPQIDARLVSMAAQAGIPIAVQLITRAAEALGVGLVNITHIFNPEKIVLGGGLTQMGDMLIGPALRVFQERTMKVPRQAAQIVMAQLGANVGLVGAGALVYYYQ